MNYRLLGYVIYIIVLLSIIIAGSLSKTIEVSFVQEAEASAIEKTLDSEIDRLALKYQVSSSTVRAIIKCESSMYGSAINRNSLKDGTVWSSDFGPFQINDYYHEKTMNKLGLDIHNQFDSLEYGFMLFKSQGVKPWTASRSCWSKII